VGSAALSPYHANAADLRPALKAPPPAVAPPVYSWTGCYVGAHVGWGWGRSDYTSSSFSHAGTLTRSASTSLDTSGALFGGQVGCNYQFASNWVVGVQGDFAGTDFNGKGRDPLGDGDEIISLKKDWLADVTGRFGVTAFNNQALFYVKGGGAWTHEKWDLSLAQHPFFN